jgi:hypothetical protein
MRTNLMLSVGTANLMNSYTLRYPDTIDSWDAAIYISQIYLVLAPPLGRKVLRIRIQLFELSIFHRIQPIF